LNNQPFLRAPRVSTLLKVKANAGPDLVYLCESLERVDFLRGRAALEALAAFLRVRIAASAVTTPISLGAGVLDLPGLVEALDKFVAGDAEGGKVGQALVAAVLDLVFAEVRTKKINDPSNTWPGDVGVFDRGTQTLSVEVKQRAFVEAEVLLFAQRLHADELHRGFVAALAQEGHSLDQKQLAFQARRLYGVELTFFMTCGKLLRMAVTFAPQDTPLSLARFPRHALRRMKQIDVSPGRMQEWADIFAVTPSTPPPG
jgi:hypothetical protein